MRPPCAPSLCAPSVCSLSVLRVRRRARVPRTRVGAQGKLEGALLDLTAASLLSGFTNEVAQSGRTPSARARMACDPVCNLRRRA
eukprot:6193380-Pleurochrysis_carterae.AAC.1